VNRPVPPSSRPYRGLLRQLRSSWRVVEGAGGQKNGLKLDE
jgi:hypothetical protein